MTRRLKWVIAAAATAALVGCNSGGLSLRERGTNTQANYLAAMYATDTASTQPAERRAFAGPAVLAVAQIGEVAPPGPMLERLRAEPLLFARVESVPAVGGDAYYRPAYRMNNAPLTAADAVRTQVDVLRGLARSTGADYLLLVGGTVDSSRGATPLSVLNLTIVGIFIVPSERLQAEMRASGALIDVRTGQLVTLASSELKRSALVPAASANGDGLRLLGRMRDDATRELADKVVVACRDDAVQHAVTR